MLPWQIPVAIISFSSLCHVFWMLMHRSSGFMSVFSGLVRRFTANHAKSRSWFRYQIFLSLKDWFSLKTRRIVQARLQSWANKSNVYLEDQKPLSNWHLPQSLLGGVHTVNRRTHNQRQSLPSNGKRPSSKCHVEVLCRWFLQVWRNVSQTQCDSVWKQMNENIKSNHRFFNEQNTCIKICIHCNRETLTCREDVRTLQSLMLSRTLSL